MAYVSFPFLGQDDRAYCKQKDELKVIVSKYCDANIKGRKQPQSKPKHKYSL
jgi:hypothetical protein